MDSPENYSIVVPRDGASLQYQAHHHKGACLAKRKLRATSKPVRLTKQLASPARQVAEPQTQTRGLTAPAQPGPPAGEPVPAAPAL